MSEGPKPFEPSGIFSSGAKFLAALSRNGSRVFSRQSPKALHRRPHSVRNRLGSSHCYSDSPVKTVFVVWPQPLTSCKRLDGTCTRRRIRFRAAKQSLELTIRTQSCLFGIPVVYFAKAYMTFFEGLLCSRSQETRYGTEQMIARRVTSDKYVNIVHLSQQRALLLPFKPALRPSSSPYSISTCDHGMTDVGPPT